MSQKPKRKILRQCDHCPWRIDCEPRKDIPGGYCETKHKALSDTIAEPGALCLGGPLKLMACHETTGGAEAPCVGWLAHQLGPPFKIETVGEQHECFEDTLPEGE